jgi:hypothetical protein
LDSASDPCNGVGDETILEQSDQLTPAEIEEVLQAGECVRLLDELAVHAAIGPEVGDDRTEPEKKFSAPAPLTAGSRVGKYRILELAGQGGFAAVFHALDEDLQREVALKIPLSGRWETHVDRMRFEREARAAAMLAHPAIVPIYEAGQANGYSFIAMAWTPGPTLHELRQQWQTPISPKDAAAAVARLADAIAHAHDRGIVHRDLKPANMIVPLGHDPDDWPETLVITDFGLARQLWDSGDRLTASDAMLGTPAWIAPEQLNGKRGSGTSNDVWALGLVLYELLSGENPFRRETHTATLRAIEHESPAALHRVRRDIDRELSAICMKCLEKSPEDRYRTAFELRSDLNRYLNGEPVKVLRVGPMGRLRRWAIRNRMLAGAIVMTVASMLAAVIVSATYAWRAGIDRQNAMAANDRLRESLDREHLARLSEQAAKEQAVLESNRQKEQYEFSIDIFRSIDPMRGGTPNPQAKELLDRAREDAERRFADDPLQYAEVLSGISRSLIGIGQFVDGMECRKQAAELYDQHAGPLDPRTLGALNLLAISQRKLGHRSAALETRREVLRRLAQLEQVDPEQVRAAEAAAAFAMYDAEEFEDARYLQGDLTEDSESRLLNMLLLYNEGSKDEAIAFSREEYEMLRQTLGEAHRRTLEALEIHAMLLKKNERLEQCLEATNEWVDLTRQHRDLDSPIALRAVALQAKTLCDLERPEEALAVLAPIMEVAVNRYGERHPAVTRLRIPEAQSHWALSHRDLAIEMMEKLWSTSMDSFGSEHFLTLKITLCLTEWQMSAGNPNRVIEILQPALEMASPTNRQLAVITRVYMTRLASALQACHRPEEAASVLRRYLTVQVADNGAASMEATDARLALAHVLFQIEHFGKAVELLSESLECLEQDSQTESLRWVRSAGLLAFALHAEGEDAEADALATQVLNNKRVKRPWSSLMLSLRASIAAASGNHPQSQQIQPTTLITLRNQSLPSADFNERWLIVHCAHQYLRDQEAHGVTGEALEMTRQLVASFETDTATNQ